MDYPWGAERLHRLSVQQPLLPTATQGQGGKASQHREMPVPSRAPQECLFPSEPGHRCQASQPPVSFSWAFGFRADPQLMDPGPRPNKPARLLPLSLGHHPPPIEHVPSAPLREDSLCPSGHRSLPDCHQRFLLHCDVPVSVTVLGSVGKGQARDPPTLPPPFLSEPQ